MTEAGGPTTQSGILYQNSIAALYLGRLLDLRPVPAGKRVSTVRLEAPERIDDIVIGFTNGSRLLIQAKDSLSVSSAPWTKFWADLDSQLKAPESRLDEYRLVLGVFSDDLEHLREACDRSQGKESATEWIAALNKQQRRLIDSVATALSRSAEDVLTMLKNYLGSVTAISRVEWPWVAGAINALSSQGHPIDLDILWAVFNKGDDLPTWHALECIWSAKGMSCCDDLKNAYATRPHKRGEILRLFEKVAPTQGLRIRATDGQLHIERLA